MADSERVTNRVRSGLFEIDVGSGELYKDGRKVALQQQPFRVLAILLERPGELVSRQDLQTRLWPADTYVGFDEGLNVAIRKLRAAFGDSAENPRFIETVPRRGYRFIGPVTRLDVSANDQLEQPSTTVRLEPRPRRSLRLIRSWPSRIVVVSTLLLVAVVVMQIRRDKGPKGPVSSNEDSKTRVADAASSANLLIAPLTSLGGEQRMPAISPDGSRIAFRLQTKEPKKTGIYVVVAGSSSVLQLSANENDSDPAWSADGRFIAFLRTSGDTFSIWLVSTLGGQERQIYSGTNCPWEGPVSISFSPDGQHLAFAEWSSETQRSSIKVISLSDSSVHSLTTPPSGYNDSAPTFSPTGTWLAFIRWTGPIFVDDVFVIPASGGDAKQVTLDHRRIFSAVAWTPNEREILFSSARSGMKSLWRIPAIGGDAKPIAGPGPNADHPSVSSNGELAYQHDVEEENLWRVDLDNAGQAAVRPLLSPKTSNLMPDFSPDGRKIAFESDRSGYEEIWICNPDGSNPEQVTKLERYSGSPRWSPDGRYIAFDFRSQQHTEVYVVEVGVGSPRPVASFPDADNVVPGWSRDGRWVYFASNRGGKTFRLWKAPLDGGPPIQLTNNDGFRAYESADGTVFYTRFSKPGMMKLVRGSGGETMFWNGPGPDNWANWALSGTGVYLIDSDSEGNAAIKFLDLRTRQLAAIVKLKRPSFYGLAVQPDHRALVYSQHDRIEHDIVLLKNF